MKQGWTRLVAALAAFSAAVLVPEGASAGPCTLPPGRENFEQRTVVLPGGAELALAWIEAGAMEIGKDGGVVLPEKPSKKSKAIRMDMDGFWIGVCEVTQQQWKDVMGSNPSYFRGEELPVECVSWEDCTEFCRRTGLRLPTEMEWLFASSASGQWNTWSWTGRNSGGRTHPVGRSNAGVGLFDMDGNVCEWCADWFAPWPSVSATNYAGPDTGTERVVCGGCWCGDEWFAQRLQKERLSLPPGSRYNNVGFRVCLTPSAGRGE